MPLFNKALIAIGDLLRLKAWTKTRFSYAVDQFAVGLSYRLLNNFLAKDFFFTEAWFIPYLEASGNEAFLDVGANVGFYTLRMAKSAEHVFAFEPNPEAYTELKAKTKGLPNVTCFPYALGKSNSQVELHLFKETTGSEIKGESWSEVKKSFNSVMVPCFTLDSLLEKNTFNGHKIGLIKIDVEGAEYEVLQGAKNLLKVSNPRLLLEIHGKDSYEKCMPYLREVGYKAKIVKHYNSWNLWWLIAEAA
jgi:FkbM family methyltransferase